MKRFRDHRIDQETRDRFAETNLIADDFIYPYFIVPGTGIKREIPDLKDVYHFSIDELIKDLEQILKLGITKVLLFGVIPQKEKDQGASAAIQSGNLISQAVKNIKSHFPSIMVITDICICGYTDHGHCGLVQGETVLNDESLAILSKMALLHAYAGADMVAPSAMMDGQVEAIRNELDRAGLRNTKILSYAAKYASKLYGPFRSAVESAPSFGDRRTYQMDFRNSDEAMDEIEEDFKEGSDWIMVKPAIHYLDIIQRARVKWPEAKLAAYHVSGEYMQWKLASEAGLIDPYEGITEVFTAIKRAGSNYIISYASRFFIQAREEE